MKFRSITLELLRQQRRVRAAEEQVWRDQFETAIAYRRFIDQCRAALSSPQGLVTSMAAGFVFERVRSPGSLARGSLQQQVMKAFRLAIGIRRMLTIV